MIRLKQFRVRETTIMEPLGNSMKSLNFLFAVLLAVSTGFTQQRSTVARPAQALQPRPNPSAMLEERLRSVVTVEVDTEGATVSPLFGFAIGDTGRESKPSPYLDSYFSTRTGASGSGFVIHKGTVDYVVTNAHVVRDTNLKGIIAISLTGKRYQMELVGVDSIRDIAVLKFVERPGTELTPASFRTDPVRVGERVYALGTPLGRYPSSVSEGIVSGLNRQSVGNAAGYVQSTAALSGGNSGGPLVDEYGKVVGVNTWGAVDPGSGAEQMQLNFSLNSLAASDTVDQIVQNGRVIRGSLGVVIGEDLTRPGRFSIIYSLEDLPETLRAKLKGRQLAAIQGVPIRNAIQLFGLLDSVKPNQSVQLSLAASNNAAAEDVTITSQELSDSRLKAMAGVYLQFLVGVQVAQAEKGLNIELKSPSYGKPSLYLVKSVSGNFETVPVERPVEKFNAALAGFLPLGSTGPRLTEEGIYGIPDERALYLLSRAHSANGVLTFLFHESDMTYALVLSPMVEETPVRFLFH